MNTDIYKQNDGNKTQRPGGPRRVAVTSLSRETAWFVELEKKYLISLT